MWQYNNIRFIYSNEVDGVFGQQGFVPSVTTYIKSKYALMQALNLHVESSFLGPYVEINQKSVKHDPPIKV